MDGAKLSKECDYYRINEDNGWLIAERGYVDNVSGYTIIQIQNAIFKSRSLSLLYSNLLHDYDNETEYHLYNLYTYWDSAY